MKKTLATLVLVAFAAAPGLVQAEPANGRTASEMVTDNAALEGRIVQAKVNGMVCDFCAQSLTKVLNRNDAVEDIDISLETRLITITVRDGMSLSDEEVEKAVYWAGYDLVKIERA